jgi:predicted nucleic acid-binding protein
MPLAGPARSIIKAVREGSMRSHPTPEVIQEFAHVRARRTSRTEAADLAQAFTTALAPLQVVGSAHLMSGMSLWRDSPQLGSFDAVLAATALALDAELISADQAFGAVRSLRWQDLGEWRLTT